jgi:hypothetical protein
MSVKKGKCFLTLAPGFVALPGCLGSVVLHSKAPGWQCCPCQTHSENKGILRVMVKLELTEAVFLVVCDPSMNEL